MPSITNIAAYQFAALTDLKPLRERLLVQSKAWNLKGTILLSREGINLFVAGERPSVDNLLSLLRGIPGLENLTAKYSESDHQPFTRMLVRIKKEIIAFGVVGIDPVRAPSPKLAPRELKRWLDEGRPITLLDTRNDYEVKLGTFAGALSLGIDNFREFPAASQRLPAEMKQQPVVMFCTGGIRCEKAGPFLEREGFQQLYQLEGGILKYFEECGGEHYQGECFVFDQRVGLDPHLQETESDQCYACLTPLTPEDQTDARFQKGVSCPYCYRTSDEDQKQQLCARQAALCQATNPLPGSQPYDNYRPLDISSAHRGWRVIDFLTSVLKHVPREDWLRELSLGRILNEHHQPVSPDHLVRAGERYLHWLPATKEPDVNADIRILDEDEALIVLDKPAPLPLHPSGRFHRNTLQYLLHQVYQPQRPRPVHRLDANTTGVVIFARTRHFAGQVQPQFERGEVEKIYMARVQGHPPEDVFNCTAPIRNEAGDLGSRNIAPEQGLAAETHFEVLARLVDGTTIVKVRPLSGRTNQIRLHLWELGFPIVGEQTYLPGKQLGDTQTHRATDPPLCLHAYSLALLHPLRRERVTYRSSLPAWIDGISVPEPLTS